VGDELSILPDGVRTHEIQQTALFGHPLLFVKNCSTLREFEQADTFIQVSPVCVLMFLNLPQDVFLFPPPLTTFLLIKLPGDLAVQFVKIDRI
jgi:hypothetical protein